MQNSNLSSPEKKTTRSPSEPSIAASSLSRDPGVPPIGGTAVVAGGRYNFPWCLEYLARHGRQMFGSSFNIRETDHDLIYRLLIYLLADEAEAERLGINLKKGILLTGPIGCGKTSLMALMRTVPQPGRNYRIRSTRDVSFEFMQDGFEVIHRYSKMSYTGDGPRHYCFDDLGAEKELAFYGNQCNVMAEIILSRYEHFHVQGMLTHITTNLSSSEIEKQYGPRVRSRMREMFNMFAYTSKAPDRRQ